MYMEPDEITDLPTAREQSYTHNEDKPVESVTNWLRVVLDNLASPHEETNLSEVQQGVDQFPLPTYPPNHQNPPVQSSPIQCVSPPPKRDTQSEVSPYVTGEIYEDGPLGKGSLSYHRCSQRPDKRTAKRGPRSPAKPFEPSVAALHARLLAEGATPGSVHRLWDIFPQVVSAEALMAPLSTGSPEKKWTLFVERARDDKWSPTYSCRLCPPHDRRQYKESRGVLRHLRKDHFGLPFVCENWWVGVLCHG